MLQRWGHEEQYAWLTEKEEDPDTEWRHLAERLRSYKPKDNYRFNTNTRRS